MTFPDDKKGRDGTKSVDHHKTAHLVPEKRARRRAPASDVGHALRSVYDRALHEDIPPEMLDLLGKLD